MAHVAAHPLGVGLAGVGLPVSAGTWGPVPDQTKVNQPPFNSQAEGAFCYDDDVFAAEGRLLRPAPPAPLAGGFTRHLRPQKVIISDTDHYAPAAATTLGLEILPVRQPPILLDFGIIDASTRPTRCRSCAAALPLLPVCTLWGVVLLRE